MYCIKTKQELKEYVAKKLNQYGNIDTFMNDVDTAVKEFNKAKKSYNYWTNIFRPFDNPKNGPEAFANSVANSEKSPNSLYKRTMEEALWQFEALTEAILEFATKNLDMKKFNAVERKVNTRRNRLNK